MLPEARRPAFATTFEASGDNGPLLVEQWRNKQVHLLNIPGETLAEQQHAFLCFLDELAGRVAVGMPQLFLAAEVQVSPQLTPLRKLLIEEVGAAMEEFAGRGLTGPAAEQDVRYLADVLQFLTAHGWRPASGGDLTLSALWEHLAKHAEGPAERHRLLLAALGTAEAFEDVERIRKQLAETAELPAGASDREKR